MIFSSAAEGTVLPGVAAEEAVSGDAPAVELEVVGPLDGLLAGTGALDGRAAAEEVDELVLVVVVLAPLGALPEGLHPASNTVAAVRHANVDGRACDFLGICMTIAFGYVMAAFERGRPNSSQYCNPVAERFPARKLHTSANRNSVNGSVTGRQGVSVSARSALQVVVFSTLLSMHEEINSDFESFQVGVAGADLVFDADRCADQCFRHARG